MSDHFTAFQSKGLNIAFKVIYDDDNELLLGNDWPAKDLTLHKKWSLPLRISLVNVSKSEGNFGFGEICWRNLQWKNSFLSSVISSRDHCQRLSLSQISNKPRAWFECDHNLSSGFVECSCAVVITTTPHHGSNMKLCYCLP